jgi:hypothetical protein
VPTGVDGRRAGDDGASRGVDDHAPSRLATGRRRLCAPSFTDTSFMSAVRAILS